MPGRGRRLQGMRRWIATILMGTVAVGGLVLLPSSATATVSFVQRFGGQLREPNEPGKFGGPIPLTVTKGAVYAGDNSYGTIEKFSTDGTFIKQTTSLLGTPWDMDADAAGNLYILNYQRIRVYDGDFHLLRQWALPPVGKEIARGLTVDAATDTVYVADTGNSQILRYDTSGTLEATIPLGDTWSYRGPHDVAVTGSGDMILVGGTSIERLRPDGTVASSWYVSGASFRGVAVDPWGDIHVADANQYGANSVFVFSTLGTLLDAYGPKGDAAGQLQMPAGGGIDIDADGAVYVGDSHYISRWQRAITPPPPPPPSGCARQGHQTGNVAVCADTIVSGSGTYTATGNVTLDGGVSVGNGPFKLDDAAKRITGSGTMKVGSHEWGDGAINVDARAATDPVSGRGNLAKFSLRNPITFVVGNVPLGTIAAGQWVDPAQGGGVIASVQPGFDLLGALKNAVTKGAFAYGFHADVSGAQILGGSIELGNLTLPGGWKLGTLKVTYADATDTWGFAGGGSLPFLKDTGLEVSGALRGRRLDALGVKVKLSGGAGVPLGNTGIILDTFGGSISGLAKGPIIIKALTAGGWTKTGAPKPFNWLVHIKDVTLTIDTSGGGGLSGGIALLDGEGRLAKGTIDLRMKLDPFEASGTVTADMNYILVSLSMKAQGVLTSEHLTATGSGTGSVAGFDVVSGRGVFSEKGTGATVRVCYVVDCADIGYGLDWKDVRSFPPDVRWIGADVDQYVTVEPTARRTAHVAAQAPYTVDVAPKQPLLVVEARGDAASDTFTLISPTGTRYPSTEKLMDSYVASYDGGRIRALAVHFPAAGRWTIEPASTAAGTKFTVSRVPRIGRVTPRRVRPSSSRRRPLSRRRTVLLSWTRTAALPTGTRVSIYASSRAGRPGRRLAKGLPTRGHVRIRVSRLRRGVNYFTAVVSKGGRAFDTARFPGAAYRRK